MSDLVGRVLKPGGLVGEKCRGVKQEVMVVNHQVEQDQKQCEDLSWLQWVELVGGETSR